MIGFILVTHAGVGAQMVHAVEEIIKEKIGIPLIEVNSDQPTSIYHEEIRLAIESLGEKSGVLILTDLFGATPSNLCRAFCKPGKIELLSGCNLPMLLKAATSKLSGNVSEAAKFLKDYGNENIRICPS
jgi:Phosphotransferase system, mannose/fructose-specific component IIA